jgi:hypothetical protein
MFPTVEKKIIQTEQIIYIDFSSFIEKDINFEKIIEDFSIIFPDLKPFFIYGRQFLRF